MLYYIECSISCHSPAIFRPKFVRVQCMPMYNVVVGRLCLTNAPCFQQQTNDTVTDVPKLFNHSFPTKFSAITQRRWLRSSQTTHKSRFTLIHKIFSTIDRDSNGVAQITHRKNTKFFIHFARTNSPAPLPMLFVCLSQIKRSRYGCLCCYCSMERKNPYRTPLRFICNEHLFLYAIGMGELYVCIVSKREPYICACVC